MDSLVTFFKKNLHHAPTAALIIGFVWDYLTLGRQDSIYGNVVILSYLALAGIGILVLNLEKVGDRDKTTTWLLSLVQFCFGNLASGLFILYSQSATLIGNWPFFFLLGGFAVLNEFARSRYARIYFQISALYLFIITYTALAVPVFLGEMGARIFLYSGLASVAILFLYLVLFRVVAPQALSGNRQKLYLALGGVFVVFNGLYFLNLIPPVPLVLKDVGAFHDVSRLNDGSYQVTYEAPAKYEFFKRSDSVLHIYSGETAYCFSSVFAPVGLSAPIYHRWEYKNETTGWVTSSFIEFPIAGGREAGYRGFSEKKVYAEGKWRCSVETNRGALIGRATFEVRFSEPSSRLQTDIR